MHNLKKASLAALGAFATIAPSTAVFAEEVTTPSSTTTTASTEATEPNKITNATDTTPSENTGRVNYVYKVKESETQLGDGFKEGTIGEDYVINPEVIKGYKYVGVEGNASGKFSNETPTVTFYYEATNGETAEKPKKDESSSTSSTDKKKDDIKPSDKKKDSSTSSSTDKKKDETKTEIVTPTDTAKPTEQPAEVVNPTISNPVEVNDGEKVVGTTDNGQVIVSDSQGQTSVVSPDKVGGKVNSDGSIELKDKSGKLVKIPTAGAAAALVSIMLAGGSASASGVATFLRSKRK